MRLLEVIHAGLVDMLTMIEQVPNEKDNVVLLAANNIRAAVIEELVETLTSEREA